MASERMLGKYKLLEVKGSGSFGTLWLAEDIWLERRLALKIPHSQNGDLKKLLSEPRLLAALDHPHIVRLITVDQIEKTLMVVMEYVDGADLRSILSHESLPLATVIDLAKQILSALAYAHSKGVVHRDLKPTNVLVNREWQVKVTDFGTAIAQGDAEIQGGGPAGTLAYMSKEQLSGHPVPASDIYSMGVMLYEMVTGNLPFNDPVAKILITKIVKESPIAPRRINPRIPLEFERIILKAMEKELMTRYGSAGEMIRDLEALPTEVVSAQIRTPNLDESSEAPTIEIGKKKAPEAAPAAKTLSSLWTQGYEYRLVSTLALKGREDGQLVSPVDVALDERGYVYVLDSMRSDLQVFDGGMKFLYKVGGPRRGGAPSAAEAHFVAPQGLDMDREGNIVVIDSRSCMVQRMNKEGRVQSRFGGPFYLTPGRHESSVKGFNNPRDLALDKRGQVYVADTGNNRVAVFSSTGEPRFKFGIKGTRRGDFNAPVSVAVDEANRVLVLDSMNFAVKIFGSGGEFRDSFGNRGTGDSELDHPSRMAVDKEGNIYILDRNRVKIFRHDGVFFSSLSPDKDGQAPSELSGLAVGADGSLVLSDSRGVRVLRYELAPAGKV